MFEDENALTGAQEATDQVDGWEAEDETAGDAEAAQEAQDLFDDWGAEDGAADDPSADGDGARQEEAAESTPAGEEEPKYKVKFYGQEKELPVSELITAAQKGMDYDNVRGKLEAASPAVRLVEQYAAANGMTLDQYLEVAQQGLQEQKIQRQVAAGVPEAEARQEAELTQLRAARRAQQAQAARVSPFVELLQAYPAIQSVADMPPQVLERIAAGEAPLSAYRAWENGQLKAQIAARAAEGKNRRRAPGSAGGLNGREKNDAFSAGFDSAFEF